MRSALSYVLPLRMTTGQSPDELTCYLRTLADCCDDVIVVDGSAADVFDANHRRWSELARHVRPDPAHASLNGKVPGVLTGVDLSIHERIVIADDDVRYERPGLERVAELLDRYDLVRPQNYFSPLPWHARWDTARMVLNRAIGEDFPGTLGVRRSTLRAVGGYDGNVLFENLELIRTIEAAGCAIVSPRDLFVKRLPPTTGHFWGQRIRQAYDEFALPHRMLVWLAVVPAVAGSLGRGRRRPLVMAGAATIALAERGRRRDAGRRVFPGSSSLLAPVWVLERGICAWLAVVQWLRMGGVRYGDTIIPLAAHSRRYLNRRDVARRRMADRRESSVIVANLPFTPAVTGTELRGC